MLFLPNGASIAIATLAPSKPLTAVSNAAPAVATSAAHGLAAGTPLLVSSGWGSLDGRVLRVGAAPQADSFKLDGTDTTDTLRFPAGGGVGTAQAPASWTAITQILESTSSGGDQSFYDFSYLEDPDSNQMQVPTSKSARNFTLTLADDPTKAWYPVLDAADQAKAVAMVRVVLPSGGFIYYATYVSFDKVPTMTKNQGMSVKAVFAIQRFIRYAAA